MLRNSVTTVIQGLNLGEAGLAVAAGSNVMLLCGTTNAICQLQARIYISSHQKPSSVSAD